MVIDDDETGRDTAAGCPLPPAMVGQASASRRPSKSVCRILSVTVCVTVYRIYIYMLPISVYIVKILLYLACVIYFKLSRETDRERQRERESVYLLSTI